MTSAYKPDVSMKISRLAIEDLVDLLIAGYAVIPINGEIAQIEERLVRGKS